MAKVTSGVFPVYANSLEVLTDEDTWSTIAELEECKLGIDNSTEEWNSFGNEGWGSALVTAKSSKIDGKGKRCVGDAGNDFIAGKLMENGTDAYVSARIVNACGKTITWNQMACSVTDAGNGGKSTDVAALEFTLTGHGKPTVTDTSAS